MPHQKRRNRNRELAKRRAKTGSRAIARPQVEIARENPALARILRTHYELAYASADETFKNARRRAKNWR